jgi:hypothetical protein
VTGGCKENYRALGDCHHARRRKTLRSSNANRLATRLRSSPEFEDVRGRRTFWWNQIVDEPTRKQNFRREAIGNALFGKPPLTFEKKYPILEGGVLVAKNMREFV